ncbi:F-box protein PP2-B13, partial [Cucurbita argyrosperma subsp. argyrosperma]
MAGISGIGVLPEDCISAILSLTTPTTREIVLRRSLTFRSRGGSDVVWRSFCLETCRNRGAPLDISGGICHSVRRERLSSDSVSRSLSTAVKRALMWRDFPGRSVIIVSKESWRSLGALYPLCWSWKSDPQSRIRRVAELRASSWVEIHGRTRTGRLSPNTLYGAYLVVKISEKGYGLDLMPAQVCVQLGDALQSSQGSVWLRRKEQSNLKMESLFYGNRRERAIKLFAADLGDNFDSNGIRDLRQRDDGWSEIELGEFFTGEDDEHLTMSFLETKGFQLKSGLVVQAIQIRPKH